MSAGPRPWLSTIMFLAVGMLCIALPMVPMGLSTTSVPFPDLLFDFLAAWLIRRPSGAPMLAVAFLALLGDAFLMRPLGLWAVLLVVGSEGLRLSPRAFRDIPFLLEWLYVAVLLVILTVLQNAILLVSFSHIHGFMSELGHIGRTVAIYPLVVLFLRWGLGIRARRTDKRPNRLGVTL